MKKLFLILAFTFSWFYTAVAQKSHIYELFDKYQNTEGITSIKIGKPMFGMLSKLDIGDSDLDELKPMLNNIKGLRILVLEKPEKADSTKADFRKLKTNFNTLQADISKFLSNLNYEELMTVNSKGNKVKFLATDAVGGFFDDLLLSVNDEKSTVLMLLDGKISMNDVNTLANESQKPGGDAVNQNKSVSYSDEIRNVGRFQGIEVRSGIRVNFRQGMPQQVKVYTDEGKQQYVKTEVVNGILKIYVDNRQSKNLIFKKLSVDITSPQLSSLTASSGSSFNTLNTVTAESFSANVSSAANISANLDVKTLKVDASSGSSASFRVSAKSLELIGTSGSSTKLTGTVQKATFEVSSAAIVNAQELKAGVVRAEASSGGSLKIYATDELSTETSSGGLISYKGSPQRITTSNHSGGNTKRID